VLAGLGTRLGPKRLSVPEGGHRAAGVPARSLSAALSGGGAPASTGREGL